MVLEYYLTEIETQLIQAKLKSAQIYSFISKDDEGGMRPQLSYTGGFKLMINEKDFDSAVKILRDKRTKDEYYETNCKHCGADVILNKKEYDDGKYICPNCHKGNKLD